MSLPEFMSPEDLKGYTQIGKGGQGTVYNKKDLVLKVPLDHLTKDWKREIKMNKYLQDKKCTDFTNIVKMIENGINWIQFEKMDYTLDNYILATQHKTIQFESQLKPIFQQIISGLDVLHSMGISHGDLKPQNILVKVEKDNSINIKLADFGCARIYNDYKGEKFKFFQCDMYQLGVIIHEMWYDCKPIYQIAKQPKKTSVELSNVIVSLISCSEERVKFDKLKDDKYWNYYLLQPFPGMKILKAEEFKLKLAPSGYLTIILRLFRLTKDVISLKNKDILIDFTKYIIELVKKPQRDDDFAKKCRQLYRKTQKHKSIKKKELIN